jgi:hypothetical protein
MLTPWVVRVATLLASEAMGRAEPVALEPVALEPVALEPVALEPVAVALEPVALEPVALEPVVLEPVVLEPVALRRAMIHLLLLLRPPLWVQLRRCFPLTRVRRATWKIASVH